VDRFKDKSKAVPRRRGVPATYEGTPPDVIVSEATLREAVSQLRRIEADMEQIYGLGFRQAHAALQGRTLPELLAHVKEHKMFPPVAVVGNLGQEVQFLASGRGNGGPRLGASAEMAPNVVGENPLERLAGTLK